MSPNPQETQKTKYYLSSIFPSKEVMEEVEAIIADEKQYLQDVQANAKPPVGGRNYLSSIFPSKEVAEEVMRIVREMD